MDFDDFYFNKFLTYKDARFFTLKSLNTYVRQNENKISKNEKIQQNIIKVLFLSVESINNSAKLFEISVSLTQYKKLISKIWLFFLRISLSPLSVERILEFFDERIFPFIEQPRLLSDFLINSFHSGYFNGLFGLINLMLKHNVECPDFYPKLYHHLVQGIEKSIDCDTRMKLWRALEIVLQSTHLPTYVLASFIKLLTRKTLFSELPDVIIILNIVGKLLSVHEPTRFLLSSSNKAEETDKFDPNQIDFTKNMVSKSFLWEFQTLLNHNNIFVRDTVKSLCEDSVNAWNWRLTYLKVPQTYNSVSHLSLATMTLMKESATSKQVSQNTIPNTPLFTSNITFDSLKF